MVDLDEHELDMIAKLLSEGEAVGEFACPDPGEAAARLAALRDGLATVLAGQSCPTVHPQPLGEVAGLGVAVLEIGAAQADALGELLSAEGETLDKVIEMRVDDEALVDRITARSTCAGCGEVYNDATKPIPADGKCTNCGGTEFKRRADDNAESLKTRLMEYYKQTSPLIGYYYAKGLLSRVDGLGSMKDVADEIKNLMGN